MEPYSIRENWSRFNSELVAILKNCNKTTLKWNTFKEDIDYLQQAYSAAQFLGNLCKDQGLHVAGSVKPSKDLLAVANLIFTMQNCRIGDNRSGFDNAADVLQQKLGAIIAVSNKKNVDTKEVEDKAENDTEKKIIQLGLRIREETAAIKNLLSTIDKGDYVVVQGSIGVNHLFASNQMPDNFSRISMQAEAGRNLTADKVPPLFVFHNQTFVAVKPLIQKFYFRKTPLSSEERFQRMQRSIHKIQGQADEKIILYDPNLVNYSGNKWLMSKAFKGVVFFWYLDRMQYKKMGTFPEKALNVLWE